MRPKIWSNSSSPTEGVVLRGPLALLVVEVQRHLVPHLDTEEGTERHRFRQPEQVRHEFRRGLLVARVDDGVVELDRDGFGSIAAAGNCHSP